MAKVLKKAALGLATIVALLTPMKSNADQITDGNSYTLNVAGHLKCTT
jgi:hypothetical protein